MRNQIFRQTPTDISFKATWGQRGQAAVEYVLLLMVVTVLASLVWRQCVSRQEGNEGSLIKVWSNLVQYIGEDRADTTN